MKHVFTFGLLLLLISCGQKQAAESSSTDTVKSEPVTPTFIEKKDSVVAEPVATQTTPTETTKQKKDTGPKPVLCKFQKLEAGDCLRYVFDCGSFGVEAISLPKDQADVWNGLMTFDGSHGDEPIANPDYVGKTFAIIQTSKERELCQGGSMVKQKAITITSFRLSK